MIFEAAAVAVTVISCQAVASELAVRIPVAKGWLWGKCSLPQLPCFTLSGGSPHMEFCHTQHGNGPGQEGMVTTQGLWRGTVHSHTVNNCEYEIRGHHLSLLLNVTLLDQDVLVQATPLGDPFSAHIDPFLYFLCMTMWTNSFEKSTKLSLNKVVKLTLGHMQCVLSYASLCLFDHRCFALMMTIIGTGP